MRSREICTTLLLAMILLLVGCGGQGSSSTSASETINTAKLTPSCFVGGATPLIDNTAPDPLWTWSDPHVLKVNGEYWMYASSTDNFVFPVKLYRLTSADDTGYVRNPVAPVLEPSAAGSWDAGGVETPAVVYFQGQYHLFWTGYPYPVGDPSYSVYDFRIGHATSSDGVTWTRDPGNPIVSPSPSDSDTSNDWYEYIVGEPGPVVYNGQIYLYFTAVGVDYDLGTSLQVIGLVTSADGYTWSAPQLVLKPDQSLWPRGDGWVGYSTPNAIVLNNAVHLFYDVAYDPTGTNWKQVRLHHSWSNDGTAGWVQDATPIASVGQYAWNTDEIGSPDALLDGTTLRLYYAGHNMPVSAAPNLEIAEKTCDLSP